MENESTIIDYKMEYNNNSSKEILSNLLKKMLDHKITKLEKRHKEETNALRTMSKISQNIIITLQNYTKEVKKEIYKIRHKYDENSQKKNEIKSSEKNDILNTDINIESFIESKENILEKSNINNISNIEKIKRGSKSIDAKKAKELFLSPETSQKKMIKIKKEKTDVFSRLASKSIGNFKKNKMNIIEQLNNNNSKSKSKKNISKKKINNIQNKKNDINLNIKEDTPSRPEKKTDKSLLKLTSTPKAKQKQLKRFSQISLEMTKTAESTQTLREKNSKTLNSSKIKKMNSKSKIISKKTKKEEKKENQENINDISVDNKIKEIKIENVILSDKDLKNENFQEEKKKSINDKILLDEEILNNVNKDELLISTIKIENINETENNNIDNNNLIKDFSLKESINTNIDINNNNDNNNLIKRQSSEINNSLNSFNKSNNDINNIKLINSNNEKKEEKKKEKYKSNICDLDNIVLPKRITNFLDNDKEINFSLINNSQNEFDNNDQEFNKTIDLNISGLSEHLSLEEKFEGHLDEITRFLDTNDLCKLMLVNKECYKTIMNILISKTEITIDILEEEISKIKESNKDINFDELKINPFKFNENSSRAVFLLNNNSDFNLININNKMSREIFIIFGIFFIAVGKKKEYINLITDEEKMNYTNNYFKKENSLGKIIEKEIKGKIFDDKIIASLYKYSYRYLNIISPNRFQKINKDFAIFVFVIKNILEHIGALEEKNEPQKEYILYNARLKNNKEILEILNGYFDKIE
jgi:hypothetical protein